MNKEITEEMIYDMLNTANYRAHATQLNVPLLMGLEVKESNNPQTILVASNNHYLEQLTSDGALKEGEFLDRINVVIDTTKHYMKDQNCENVDNSFLFYQDYNNGVFDFKIYVQDTILPVSDGKKAVRTMIAYFEEPKMHDFYQLSLAVGPFVMPTEELTLGVIDLENDATTKELERLMKLILTHLRYKDFNH